MIDLSIVIPSFRPHRWVEVYNSISQSCTRYSFEIIFVGPYPPPPDELKDNPQIKYIEDWGGPTRCTQIGAISASGRLIMIGLDDVIFFPYAIDESVQFYNTCNDRDFIVLRYREGFNFTGKIFDDSYYYAKTSYHTLEFVKTLKKKHRPDCYFEQLNIPDHFRISTNPLLSVNRFIELGGFDCVFEHLAWANHDFCYRIQRDGGIAYLSPVEVFNADFVVGGEHIPIETAVHEHDGPFFRQLQKDPNVVNRIRIDIDNWKQSPEVWARRFPNGKEPHA